MPPIGRSVNILPPLGPLKAAVILSDDRHGIGSYADLSVGQLACDSFSLPLISASQVAILSIRLAT